jgi:adenine-specific DNA-methyltransferase
MPYYRVFGDPNAGRPPETIWPHTEVGSNRTSKAEVKALLPDVVPFSTPKPEKLLERVIAVSTGPGELVLDSFAGSGTTGAVAHKMGRKWIMVELGDNCFTHIIPRLKQVIDGSDQGGISNDVAWRGGGGFKFYRLAESLLIKDKDLSTAKKPVYVINPKYDAKMLVRAICKIENFRYLKDNHWHGISSEHHFLYVTTRLLSQRHLDTISAQLGGEEALLVYCTRRTSSLKVPDNIEVKKIPRDLLAKCTFE